MSDWYMYGDQDHVKLSRILDITQALKGRFIIFDTKIL